MTRLIREVRDEMTTLCLLAVACRLVIVKAGRSYDHLSR